MSEPRKLYTGSASGGLDQEQYEAARRRAQQLAEQNARRRTVQQPMRTAQGRHISQRPVVTGQSAPAPEPPVQETVQQAAPAPERPRELTYAQRQAMAYRAAAERKYGDTLQFQVQRPRRTVNRPPEPEQRARQAAAQLYEQPAAPRRGQQSARAPRRRPLCSRRLRQLPSCRAGFPLLSGRGGRVTLPSFTEREFKALPFIPAAYPAKRAYCSKLTRRSGISSNTSCDM